MGLLKNIEWTSSSKNELVYKVDMKNDYISKGSVLTVRDSQVAIFATNGKMADVFLPGRYKLDTDSLPIITTLMSWKYGFENVFRSDVYFVNTKQFTGMKWGTSNPIIVRDKEFGVVRVRGYGSYAFRVKDAFVFMQELSGTGSYSTDDITEHIKSLLVRGITDAIGESGLSIVDIAANIIELSEKVKDGVQGEFEKMGMELTQFLVENFSLPKNLEEALDKSTSAGMMRGNMDAYMQLAQADALREAAKNPGMAGTAIGAGLGLGIGQMFAGAYSSSARDASATIACPKCGAAVKAGAKFCPECGEKLGGVTCPKCGAAVKAGAKFCPECGEKLGGATCSKCGTAVKVGAKFCPECGEKL